jgi:hypothetical protein
MRRRPHCAPTAIERHEQNEKRGDEAQKLDEKETRRDDRRIGIESCRAPAEIDQPRNQGADPKETFQPPIAAAVLIGRINRSRGLSYSG